MNLKIVMVEGPHDGAFISKVMKVNGYKTFSKHIGDYQPQMIAKYLIGQYRNAPVAELNMQSLRQQMLFPSYALHAGEDLVLIFHMCGDCQDVKRRKLVTELREFFLSATARSTGAVSNSDTLTFVYEFDADKKGVAERVNQANKEISGVDNDFKGFQNNGSYIISNGIRWGVFVFADSDGLGKLEDIILPMMEKGNEDIAACAKEFVDKKDTFVLFQKEKSTNDLQKARVGVMGQLQKPGVAAPAIIEQSSFLTEEKIKGSKACVDLFAFLSQ